MKALLALCVLLCASVVMVQCSPGLFDIDQLLEGVGEILHHDESMSSTVDSDAVSLSSVLASKVSDDMTAGAAKTSNDVGQVPNAASDSTDGTRHSSSESASPSPTENGISSSLASTDKTAESPHSQRKSRTTASSATSDGAADSTTANSSGNDGQVDNELDPEAEDAFDDTKTVVETQLVLLAPDIPNRNVIISAPMSFEALMSSTASLPTNSSSSVWVGGFLSILVLLLV